MKPLNETILDTINNIPLNRTSSDYKPKIWGINTNLSTHNSAPDYSNSMLTKVKHITKKIVKKTAKTIIKLGKKPTRNIARKLEPILVPRLNTIKLINTNIAELKTKLALLENQLNEYEKDLQPKYESFLHETEHLYTYDIQANNEYDKALFFARNDNIQKLFPAKDFQYSQSLSCFLENNVENSYDLIVFSKLELLTKYDVLLKFLRKCLIDLNKTGLLIMFFQINANGKIIYSNDFSISFDAKFIQKIMEELGYSNVKVDTHDTNIFITANK